MSSAILEYKRLEEEAKRKHNSLQLCKIDADGDCLWNAVRSALMVQGVKVDSVKTMRYKVYLFILNALSKNNIALGEDVTREDIEEIRKLGTWNSLVGEMMAIAIASIYGLYMIIYKLNSNSEITSISFVGDKEAAEHTINLYYNGSHYGAYIADDEECPDYKEEKCKKKSKKSRCASRKTSSSRRRCLKRSGARKGRCSRYSATGSRRCLKRVGSRKGKCTKWSRRK